MSKQHYFLVVGERDKTGFITWHVDAETQININDAPVYNTKTRDWETIEENIEEDRNMLNDLIDRFSDE